MSQLSVPILEEVRIELRRQMNNYADDVATGLCVDHSAYKELCGVIRGLAYAEAFVIDLAKKVEQDDE